MAAGSGRAVGEVPVSASARAGTWGKQTPLYCGPQVGDIAQGHDRRRVRHVQGGAQRPQGGDDLVDDKLVFVAVFARRHQGGDQRLVARRVAAPGHGPGQGMALDLIAGPPKEGLGAGPEKAVYVEHRARGVQGRQAGECFVNDEGAVRDHLDLSGQDDLRQSAAFHFVHGPRNELLPVRVGQARTKLEAVREFAAQWLVSELG